MAVIPGEGTILSVGTAADNVAPVTTCNSIGFGAIEQEAVDAFSLDSEFKVKRPSRLPDLSPLTLNYYWKTNDTQHKLVRDSSVDHTILFWKVQDVDGNTATWQGFVASFELNGMEVDSNVTADVEVQPTTLITFTDFVVTP